MFSVYDSPFNTITFIRCCRRISSMCQLSLFPSLPQAISNIIRYAMDHNSQNFRAVRFQFQAIHAPVLIVNLYLFQWMRLVLIENFKTICCPRRKRNRLCSRNVESRFWKCRVVFHRITDTDSCDVPWHWMNLADKCI